MAGLRTQNLVKAFRSRKVVNRVSLEVKQGEIVGLLGPNGAGKTTTFYMVVGLTRPDDGHVLLNDEDVTHFPMHKRAQKGVSYLPQEPSVFRKLTVEENIIAVLEKQKLSTFDRKKKARSLLRELNILHIKDSMAYSLSGGERRRVEISRALATSPVFVLLDIFSFLPCYWRQIGLCRAGKSSHGLLLYCFLPKQWLLAFLLK